MLPPYISIYTIIKILILSIFTVFSDNTFYIGSSRIFLDNKKTTAEAVVCAYWCVLIFSL